MTTTPQHIVDKRWAVKYTGSNSGEIDALITQFDIVSESGGTLNFTSNSSSFSCTTNQWIVYLQGQVFGVYSQTDFDNFYSCNPVCADLTSLQSTVTSNSSAITTLQSQVAANSSSISTNTSNITTLQSQITTVTSGLVRSVGVAPVPTLIASASATVQVTITPAMPNTTFNAYPKLFAGISIVGLQINSTTIVSTTRVDVVVQNVGLVSLAGANVLVYAVDF